jgi:DNA uptake protein ComE-like DNA-binding protein
LTLLSAGTAHSLVMRRQVWPPNPDGPLAPAAPDPANISADPAVSAVLAARTRRDESRRLAAADPLMARDLRIGRPDLPRTYDDGGLVDLNSAPVEAIAGMCGIAPALAAQIVNARRTGIIFTTVDDVFSCTDIPYPLWDRIRDRAVLING